MFFDQQEFDLRCEWGEHGVAVLAPISDVVIVVDVLSFSTSVEIAVGRGGMVYPYRWRDERALEFAASIGAELAAPRRTAGKLSLSPESMTQVEPGTRIVLPSPNGATLSLRAGQTPVLAGCLRNAQAIARAAKRYGSRIAVIPAGERWRDNQGLRPCFEDLVGAGAIVRHLAGSRSPEAMSAVTAFEGARARLEEFLQQCSSGKELIERGFGADVHLAAQLDVSDVVPVLRDNAFVRADIQDESP
jgi:2-phosphosulfolactate phosphatase